MITIAALCTSVVLGFGLGVEKGPNPHMYGSEPTGTFRASCGLPYNFSLEYDHKSSFPDGKPFNDRTGKPTSDTWSIMYNWKLK